MAISQYEIGRRLRNARKACYVTQENAAKAIGISCSALSQMESGQRGVSSLELDRLAQLYLRDARTFLDDRFEETNAVSAMFQAHPKLRAVRQPCNPCDAAGNSTGSS